MGHVEHLNINVINILNEFNENYPDTPAVWFLCRLLPSLCDLPPGQPSHKPREPREPDAALHRRHQVQGCLQQFQPGVQGDRDQPSEETNCEGGGGLCPVYSSQQEEN